jgi:hypothetical protein
MTQTTVEELPLTADATGWATVAVDLEKRFELTVRRA